MIYAAKYLLKPEGGHIEDAAVRVSGIRIDAVGTLQEMRMRYPEDRIEDFGMAVLAPGFVDAHTHLEYSTMNGIFEDAPYAPWKASIVEKGRLMTPEDWDDSALFGAMASIQSGITSISDVTRTGASLRACLATGMHGVVYREVTASTKAQVEPAMQEAKEDIVDWRSQVEGLAVQVGIGPDALYATHPEVLSAIGDYAMDGTPVAVHVAGSREECDFIRYGSSPFALASSGREHEAYRGIQSEAFLPMGVSPVRYALNWGIFYAPNVLAIHCVHVNAEDIGRLRDNDVRIVVCTRSNAKLGCGIAPIQRFMDNGITVGLGTNSAAAADASDMFDEMRFTLLVERGVVGGRLETGERGFLSAGRVMRMGNIEAARAIGTDREVGSLEPGKRADIAVFDISHSTQVPTDHPTACLIHDARREDVLMTMIDGKPIWRRDSGFMIDVDMERLEARAKEIRQKLRD
ncbi:MAG: amidohydrolase family protein [Atopobiaceae bacterium]|nr:amidohydrolase family protein [Atopobiaceae bacterium]